MIVTLSRDIIHVLDYLSAGVKIMSNRWESVFDIGNNEAIQSIQLKGEIPIFNDIHKGQMASVFCTGLLISNY